MESEHRSGRSPPGQSLRCTETQGDATADGEQLCSAANHFSSPPHGAISHTRALISAISCCDRAKTKPNQLQGHSAEQKQQFAPVNSCELAAQALDPASEVPGQSEQPKHMAKH